jgi:hypothetical protein
MHPVVSRVFATDDASQTPETVVRGQIEFSPTLVSAEVIPFATAFAQLSDECR